MPPELLRSLHPRHLERLIRTLPPERGLLARQLLQRYATCAPLPGALILIMVTATWALSPLPAISNALLILTAAGTTALYIRNLALRTYRAAQRDTLEESYRRGEFTLRNGRSVFLAATLLTVTVIFAVTFALLATSALSSGAPPQQSFRQALLLSGLTCALMSPAWICNHAAQYWRPLIGLLKGSGQPLKEQTPSTLSRLIRPVGIST